MISEELTLRHIRAFLALAACLHFGRAAVQLGVGQPLLSKRIAQTERALGVRRFYRNRRTVELTEAGVLLLSEARALLKRATHMADLAAQAASGEAGVLRIGYERTSMLSHLPAVVRRYHETCPNVVLRRGRYSRTISSPCSASANSTWVFCTRRPTTRRWNSLPWRASR